MGKFIMPSLGSQMIEARLIKWLVKPGDSVSRGDIIGEIDTEKGLIDIEVFEDGVISELVAKEGEVIPVGSVMAVINGHGTEVQAEKEQKERVMEAEKEPGLKAERDYQAVKGESARQNGDMQQADRQSIEKPRRIKASPLARRVAEDLNVDLGRVKGSGIDGAIHKKDVEAFAQKADQGRALDRDMKTDEKVSPIDVQRSMRRSIAAAMSRSNREIPHYYLESEIDMKSSLDWLEETNKQRPVGERILPPVLLIKAVANSLAEIPELNGFWTDDEMHIEEGIHIGFAVSLRRGGLVIPAILNADMKTPDDIRKEFLDMIVRAREGHLRSRELSSATITITSLGERGAEKVYGVIYPPQVALVGFGAIVHKPRAVNDAIGIRPVIHTVLAGDHRATDGHTGSRFLERLNEQLQHPEHL